MKKRFCPKCGATNKVFVRAFCVDCYAQSHSLVEFPKDLVLLVCRECGKILLNGKWHPFSEEVILNWATGKVKTKELQNVKTALDLKEAPKGFLVQGKSVGSIEDAFFSFPLSFPVKTKESLCSNCGLIKADYFEAELQLRFEKKDLKKESLVLEKVRNWLSELETHDSLAQISGIAKARNGLDIKIGSKRAGKIVAERLHREFGKEIKHSHSLAGVDKSGKTRKRYTFLVRME